MQPYISLKRQKVVAWVCGRPDFWLTLYCWKNQSDNFTVIYWVECVNTANDTGLPAEILQECFQTPPSIQSGCCLPVNLLSPSKSKCAGNEVVDIIIQSHSFCCRAVFFPFLSGWINPAAFYAAHLSVWAPSYQNRHKFVHITEFCLLFFCFVRSTVHLCFSPWAFVFVMSVSHFSQAFKCNFKAERS